MSAADSLILADVVQLMAGGVVSSHPLCTGATMVLQPGFDRGAPQPQTEVVASLLLDGERPTGRRASNRQIQLQIVIYAPDRPTLNGAKELLLSLVDQPLWTLEWTPDPAAGPLLPLVFDCFRATDAHVQFDQDAEDQLVAYVSLTFPALPYGRSSDFTTVTFPQPSVTWSPPPGPLRIDDYATESTSTQGTLWSQSTQCVADSFSARWKYALSDGLSAPLYTHTLGSTVDITSRNKISLNFGLGTARYSTWHAGPVTFVITLTDGSGHTISMGGTARCTASNDPNFPTWTPVAFTIPFSASFNYATVSAYTVRAWRRTDRSNHLILDADAYLNGLTANAAAKASIPSTRGTLYQLGDPGGTARALMSAQFQPILPIVTPAPIIQSFTTPGTFTFLPPAGVFTLNIRAKGASGKGGDRSTTGVGGGAGGGAVAGDNAYPCTPGQPLTVQVGAAGASGGFPILAASYYVEVDGCTSTSLVTPSFSPAAGEVIIVKATNADASSGFSTPTGGGLTFTNRVNITTGSHSRTAIWSATVGAAPGPMTVTVTSGSAPHAMIVERWTQAKLAATPAIGSATGSGSAPSTTVTTVAANSIVSWVNGDWSGNSGARAYRSSATEERYNFVSNQYTGYWATQQAAAAGAQTIGLTTPASQTWSLGGIEIQAFNAGALTDGSPTSVDLANTTGGGGILADGGKSVPVNTATGGLGGLVANCIGAVKFRGGNGFTGSTTGGGGGSGAGDNAQGTDATTQTGAVAPSGGGNGGNGANAGGNNAGSPGVAPAGAGGGAVSIGGAAAGGAGSAGRVDITYAAPPTPFKTLVVHGPGFDAPATFSPIIPVGAGLDQADGREYNIDSPVPGLNARYYGTYTVVVMAFTLDTPASAHTLTVTFKQYDYPAGPSTSGSVQRVFTPSTEITNGVIIVDEITLPLRDIADDQTQAFTTVGVTSSNPLDRFLDVLVIDVSGQVIAVNVAGTGYPNFYLDSPTLDRDWGRVLASTYDRSSAVSVMDSVLMLSGGPLVIDPYGPGWLMAYSPDAGAPALQTGFYARWRDSRLSL